MKPKNQSKNGKVFAIDFETYYGKELSIDNAISGMSAPFHAGAAKYFAEKGATVPTA